MHDDRPTIEFDTRSDALYADPIGTYQRLRDECPVAWAEPGGFWLVTDYEDITTALHDHEAFSNAIYRVLNGPDEPPRLLLCQDPPAHGTYRQLVNPWFTPAAIERIEPRIARFCDEQIDTFVTAGECDIALDFANIVPALTTLDLLGVPVDEYEHFTKPNHQVLAHPIGSSGHAEAIEGLKGIEARLMELAAQRREEPREDLLSALATARVGGELLPIEDVAGIGQSVVGGGVDTTTAVLCNALMHLHRDHELRERLAHDPALIRVAFEEFVRLYTPAGFNPRVVTRDCELGGQALHTGETVLLSLVSANTDAERFPHPDEVRIDRPPNRHISFSQGIHRCVGATLARAEFAVMLEKVLTRLPDYVVDEARAQRNGPRNPVNGWTTMPVTFTPGAPVADLPDAS